MAANQFTPLFSPGFSTVLDACIGQQIKHVDRVLAANIPVVECTSHDCPIVGMHNTDECEELIAEVKREGGRL